MSIRTGSFVVLALLVITPVVWAGQPVHGWSQRFGDAGGQYAHCVAVDGSGNVIVTGDFIGVVDFGGGAFTSVGGYDIFVAKFDATGNHLWSQRFGDAGGESAHGVAVDGSGNVIVTGYFSGAVDFGGGAFTSVGGYDIFVAKFDAAGTHLWSRHFGDASSQWAYGVAVDGSGNVFVTGRFEGTVDFGGGALNNAGNYDIYVAKFDAAGTHLWSQRFGDASSQYARAVAVDGSGNVFVTGHFVGAVDFGGGALTSAGWMDIYVAKFDAAGTHLWSQRFGDVSSQYAYGAAVDGSGNVFVTGYFNETVDFGGGTLTSAGSIDIYVAKFDVAGAHLWSQRFGDASHEYAEAVAVDDSGNIFVTGYFSGAMDFGGGALNSAGAQDIYVAKFDAAGTHLWSQRFGDPSNQYVEAIAVDGSGNAFVAGPFEGIVDFGGGALTSAGSMDIYVAKFWRAAPEIHTVRDIPGDQGGFVNLEWDASGTDTPAEHVITRYTVWRAIQPMLASEMISNGATLVTSASLVPSRAGNALVRMEQLGSATYYWSLIKSVDAYYLEGYSEPVPTLFDSTAVCTDYHYFQVIAHTSDPYTFWASAPDSGYSVDNLTPAQPQALMGEQAYAPEGLTLSWLSNAELDLENYAVYRGLSADFTPSSGNLIASSSDTTAFDVDWRWDSGYHYKVSAMDVHGNESSHALLEPDDVTGINGSTIPGVTFLSHNFPNPFNPSTNIAFGLKDESNISLKIYDVSGKLVRVLVEGRRQARHYEEVWDGRDENGDPSASGVYFYRLTAGKQTLTKKMVLLK